MTSRPDQRPESHREATTSSVERLLQAAGRGGALLALGAASAASGRRRRGLLAASALSGAILAAARGGQSRAHRERAERAASRRTDETTGLPNRFALLESCDRLCLDLDGEPFALVLIDLDRFRIVNDTLGHDRGDEMLVEVGRRLRTVVRDQDVVARVGGDEFALLLRGVADAHTALAAAQRIRVALEVPYLQRDTKVDVSGSMGIALAPADGTDSVSLLRCADIAMYAAKRDQCGAVVYDGADDPGSDERLALTAELRHAIANDELLLHYQPKALLGDGTIEGVEALVRWQHPERGLVPPGLFIPLAEQTGLIREITIWVVDAALRQAREWRAQGVALIISVNISAKNLLDPFLERDISDLLERWGAEADWIRLEVTESAVMEDPTSALRSLNGLADMGIELAMDDYGTGHSALSYLKRLPLRELKIDRSFVTNMTTDQADAMIIASTIELGHSLGLRVVAEGVETEADWLGLEVLGCDVAQGYFLGRPMPPFDLLRWLEESARPFARCVPIASYDESASTVRQ